MKFHCLLPLDLGEGGDQSLRGLDTQQVHRDLRRQRRYRGWEDGILRYQKYGENAPAFADGKVLREGAKFLGWSADSNATVATYGPRDSIRWTFAEDTTLYAVWDVYDLTFQYKDSGTGNLTTLELPYNESDCGTQWRQLWERGSGKLVKGSEPR